MTLGLLLDNYLWENVEQNILKLAIMEMVSEKNPNRRGICSENSAVLERINVKIL